MDSYDLQARQAPGIAAIAPAALVAIAAIPSLAGAKLATGSIGLLLIIALQLVATRLVRSMGLARQKDLYDMWGGIPSTAMLRHRDIRLNPQTKLIFHERLRRLGSAFPVPDEEEESRDPAAADVNYGAAMDEIRRRAKDWKVKAVHRENINYGAARNVYGLKPFGLFVCISSLTTLTALVAMRGGFNPLPLEIVVGVVIVIISIAWAWACDGEMVRRHAEAYAVALFESIESMVARSTRGAPDK